MENGFPATPFTESQEISQRMFRLSLFHRRLFTLASCCCAAICLTDWSPLRAFDDIPAQRTFSSGPGALDKKDRGDFMGARACLDCHRSEYVSWLGTQHFHNTKKNRFEASDNSIDTKYRQQTGNLKLCYTCHEAPAEERFGRTLVESGTSCESCHGAAGGTDGWLNQHAVYGPNVTRLEQETPQHQAARHAWCDAAGMIRSGQPYRIARNCFSCHIIGNPTLVGDNVKHPVSFDKFSLIPYLTGEVRHNFFHNKRHNAELPSLHTLRTGQTAQQRKRVYLIIEQFAKSEVALNLLAQLPDDASLDEDFSGELVDLFDDAAGELEDFADELAEPEDENIPSVSEDELAALYDVIEIFESFDDIKEPARADAKRAAQGIAEAAKQFLQVHDGSRLTALDAAFIEDLDDPVGEALKP